MATLRAGRPAMPVAHASVLPYCMDFKCSGLVGDVVDVHRSVAALGGDVLVQRVPCDTLNVVIVLGNLVYALACEIH